MGRRQRLGALMVVADMGGGSGGYFSVVDTTERLRGLKPMELDQIGGPAARAESRLAGAVSEGGQRLAVD
jgi:hypothetical protein